MAKYPYIVVKNGIWYPTGTEVPVDIPVEEIESDVSDEESVEEKKTTRGRKKQV